MINKLPRAKSPRFSRVEHEQDQTVCILCGNVRVFSRQWKNKVDGKGSIVTYTENVCADVECQQKVDEKFAEMRERRQIAHDRRKSIVIARRTKQKN